jgi:hypothetical protein
MLPALENLAATRKLTFVYLIGIAVSGLALSSSLFTNEPAAPAYKLVLLLLLILTLSRGWSALLLVAVQSYLLLRDPNLAGDYGWWDTGLASFSILLLIILCERLRTLLRIQKIQRLAQVRELLTGAPLAEPLADPAERADPTMSKLLLSLVLGGGACVLAAFVALSMVPLERKAPLMVGLKPTALRAIELGCLLMTTYLIVRVFVGELQWRRLSPKPAALYLQTLVTSWLFHDVQLVAWRKIKLRNKALKRAE